MEVCRVVQSAERRKFVFKQIMIYESVALRQKLKGWKELIGIPSQRRHKFPYHPSTQHTIVAFQDIHDGTKKNHIVR